MPGPVDDGQLNKMILNVIKCKLIIQLYDRINKQWRVIIIIIIFLYLCNWLYGHAKYSWNKNWIIINNNSKKDTYFKLDSNYLVKRHRNDVYTIY